MNNNKPEIVSDTTTATVSRITSTAEDFPIYGELTIRDDNTGTFRLINHANPAHPVFEIPLHVLKQIAPIFGKAAETLDQVTLTSEDLNRLLP